jgi:protein-L-isoaspartate(D-aspartate) O-methyltransferase
MDAEEQFRRDREHMVKHQLADRGIRDAKVLAAMQRVPRHLFVPEAYWHMAYADGPLPIGEGQTISQPYIVALMTQLLQLQGTETVLEVGTGSGYQAAILGCLAQKVHTIEQHDPLSRQAGTALAGLDLPPIHLHVGDGSQGLPEHAPFEAILTTAAAPAVPQPLMDQLADGGRLVLPVGGPSGQILEVWVRSGDKYDHESIAPVAFVPLRGEFGWEDVDWYRW